MRVHEPVSLIDLLDAGSTSHSWNFNDALATIARAERGVVLLLHREETAGALLERASAPQRDAPQPKIALRNYGIGAQILKDLKVKKMRLLALPRRMPSMAGFDLEVTGYLQPRTVNVKEVNHGPFRKHRSEPKPIIAPLTGTAGLRRF